MNFLQDINVIICQQNQIWGGNRFSLFCTIYINGYLPETLIYHHWGYIHNITITYIIHICSFRIFINNILIKITLYYFGLRISLL